MVLCLPFKGLVKTLFFLNLSKFGRQFLCTKKWLPISKMSCITPGTYICNHEYNVHSWLSPQWLCRNSCTWAHDVHIWLMRAYIVFMTAYTLHPSCFCEIYEHIYIYIYIYILYITTRHLNLSYISILTNLLRTVNETKSVKTIYNWIN